MPTNEERREVAARLRKAIGLHEFAEVLGFNWTDESDWVWNDVSNLVADLIEPSCDRDALLALADEIHGLVENQEIRFFHIVQVHESTLATIEARIREALGVEHG